MPQFVLLQVLGVLLLLADVCRPAPANWERLYGLADLRHSSIWPRTHTSNSSLLHDRYRRFVQNRRAPGDDFIFNLEANLPPAKASQLSPDVPDSKFASNADRWAFLPDDIRVTFNPSQAGHSVFTVQGFAYDCPGVFVGDVVPMPDERFANGLGMEGERMLVCKRAVLPVDWRTNRNTPSTGQQTETKAMWASQYNLKKRIPDWVAFYVERGLPKHPGADARKNREFRPENGLESARYGATLHETRNVFKERCNCNRHAYQLGHLAPLDQYTYNAVAAAATFSSYNVVPQFPNSNTNGGDWWFFERYLSDFLSASNQQTTINGLHVVAGTYYGDGNYEMRRKDPSASSYLAIPTHMV
ncbi:hypothetical protein BC832DRAFT_224261 [Gaertneriomyces semiglobifer]|nr:hypothetical protein BC832DRAFT_224261 [Gaertneriomyces semiglobifer]